MTPFKNSEEAVLRLRKIARGLRQGQGWSDLNNALAALSAHPSQGNSGFWVHISKDPALLDCMEAAVSYLASTEGSSWTSPMHRSFGGIVILLNSFYSMEGEVRIQPWPRLIAVFQDGGFLGRFLTAMCQLSHTNDAFSVLPPAISFFILQHHSSMARRPVSDDHGQLFANITMASLKNSIRASRLWLNRASVEWEILGRLSIIDILTGQLGEIKGLMQSKDKGLVGCNWTPLVPLILQSFQLGIDALVQGGTALPTEASELIHSDGNGGRGCYKPGEKARGFGPQGQQQEREEDVELDLERRWCHLVGEKVIDFESPGL